MLDKEMFLGQMNNVGMTIDKIYMNYQKLAKKRYEGDLPRDQYMLYDMFDMFIAIDALYNEGVSDGRHNEYMLEKVSKIKDYVDTTYNYFKAACGEDNE